ncbi:MAG: universal stress protein [Sphingorhabdus sp.]
MVRTLLMPLTHFDADEYAVDVARHIQAELNVHLHILFNESIPIFPVAALPHGSSVYFAQMIAQMRDEADARYERLKTLLPEADTMDAAITFSRVEGDAIAIVQHEAPVHDAILFLRRPLGNGDGFETPELVKDTLEECGRPILLLNGRPTVPITQKIVVAWNGSAEGARAVSAAMPLLQRATDILIVTFETTKTAGSEAGRLQGFLRRHGVEADVDIRSGIEDIGTQLTEMLQASGASLLVSGGYTHSRLRQAVMGGVTRTLLARCDVPMLLSH